MLNLLDNWYYDKVVKIDVILEKILHNERVKKFFCSERFKDYDSVQFLETGIIFIDSLNEFPDQFYEYDYFIKSEKALKNISSGLIFFKWTATPAEYKIG